MGMILEVDSVCKSFMGVHALQGVSMGVHEGEILGIIGPNGAGKTTLFNVLTGLLRQDSGKIYLDDTDVGNMPVHSRVRLGMARTFQNLELFKDMSVMENVMVGSHLHLKSGFWQCIIDSKRKKREERLFIAEALNLLSLFGMKHKAYDNALSLSYGEQRKVEIARALASRPRILFLDEPAAGMNPKETEELGSLISKIKEELQLTVVIIEHDMNLIMDICDYVVVMTEGNILTSGLPSTVRHDKKVIDAYLGGDIK